MSRWHKGISSSQSEAKRIGLLEILPQILVVHFPTFLLGSRWERKQLVAHYRLG